MPTSLIIPSPIQVVSYYVCHIIFLGHPADILARLWLAHDLAHPDEPEEDDETTVRHAWQTFEDSIRESFRTVGVLAGLVAATTSLFFSVNADISNATVRTLFLASITTAVLSAASSFTSLSTVLPDPIALERRWEESGLGFVLGLSAPSAWLSLSLWTFQAALLALVWITDETPARVVVTTLISLRLVMRVVVATSATGFREFCQGLFGWKHGADHWMIQLNDASKQLRKEYLDKSNNHSDQTFIIEKASRTPSPTVEIKGAKERRMKTDTTLVTPSQGSGAPEFPIRSRNIHVSQRAVRSARLFVAMPDEEITLETTSTAVIPAPPTDAGTSG